MSAYSDAVLALSPVGYWRLGEASGTTAVDAVGANNGTYVGSPTLGVAGLLNGDADTAVTLNGTSQYVTLGAINMSAWSGATIMALCLPTAYQGSGAGYIAQLFSAEASPALARLQLGSLASDATKNILTGYLGSIRLSWTTPLALNAISHVIITRDATTTRLYLNGSQIATVANAGSLPAAASAAIGNSTTSTSRKWIGTLDETAIWNRALSAAEIAALYAAGTKVYGTASLASTCTLSATGRKSAAGSGTLAGTVTFASAGRKSALGAGSLASVVTFANTGTKSAAGIATMALSVVLSATGRKATSGTGALIETLVMAASGVKFLWPGIAARMRLTSVSDAPSVRAVSDVPRIERLT